MADRLLLTKVSLPIVRQTLVPRKKVLRQLSAGIQGRHLLTLVSAPAGYGKTTTIRLWVAEIGQPVAWITLEKADNDLQQFLTYVLTALQQAVDDLGQAALEVVENAQTLHPQQILGLLIHDLYDLAQPIILVLEDYHLIENAQIDQFIELLLNQAIANLHLVITTREDPNLPLARLRVRNQLTEIRAMDLSFSLAEADEFFAKVMGVHLPKPEMAILQNRTEGWVAGLQLAALSLKESENPTKFVAAFRGTHRHVLDYLIEEVLNSQPAEVQTFLRRTSILDQLSPALCDAVTGQKASRHYLHQLEQNNLFLVALDAERNWYRYHALFAELLKNQLLQAEPELVDELHERAAAWYQQQSFIQQAVEHAFQSARGNSVATLIEQYALPLLYQGEVATVQGWFDRLPSTLMHASPMMWISKAWALALMQRQTTRTQAVAEALQAAEAALQQTNANEAVRNLIAGHIASIQAFIMESPTFLREKPEQLIQIAQTAQRLLPPEEKAIRSVNWMSIGYGYATLADLPAAERAFHQTLADGVAGGNFYAAIYGPINLALIAISKGQLSSTLQLCATNLDWFNRQLAGQRFPPIGALSILKGCLLLEENRLAAAEEALTQGLNLIRWTGEFRMHMKGYAALARLRAIQGDAPGLAASLNALAATRQEGARYAQALRHRWAAQGWATNNSMLAEAQLWVTQVAGNFRDFPDVTGVDPISETTLRMHLSLAHVVARLAARNPLAYPLADLHHYLARQGKFAETHGLFGWLVELWLVRALLYQSEGKAGDALRMLAAALGAAAPRGYCRLFLDEGDRVRPLLAAMTGQLKDPELAAYVTHLLAALPGEAANGKSKAPDRETLSDREIEVLCLLADGQSYKDIGQRLFLSLNTVQFHVKNIYSKLLVNKRGQAIEKAREMKLI